MASQIIGSVAKALQILNLFTIEKNEWGITELANALNMQKSTVFRLVDTMAMQGYLRKTSSEAHYRLGLKIFELGSVVFSNFNLKDVANSYIHSLSEKCGETVHMGIINENSVMSIEKSDSKNSLMSTVLIGKTSPLYCTSVGKVLLAFIDEDKCVRLLKNIKFNKYTEYTITDCNLLLEELEKIRDNGYAVDNMEHEFGIRCIAAPIFDCNNICVASMSISGPSIRITPDKDEEYARMLMDTCSIISKELGYRNAK